MPRLAALILVGCVLATACRSAASAAGQAASPVDFTAIAARVDPYVEKSRVLVMSDTANEPDDQMSMGGSSSRAPNRAERRWGMLCRIPER